MKKIIKGMLLILLAVFVICTPKVQAKATRKAKVTYNPTSKQLVVTYKTMVLGTCEYKKETLYAKQDITFMRKGPGSKYLKTTKVEKDLGEKVTRVGVIGGWAIIRYKHHYYFTHNKYLSKKKPKLASPKVYTARQLRWRGVLHWNGWRWTWYSQRRMPGHGLHIPGRHVDKNGFVCDKNGYICLASGRLGRGSVVSTPFGKKGKVYDSGCGRGTLDVYTNF